MAKGNKQQPIVLALGDLQKMVELNNDPFQDLPVEVVVCHSLMEAEQLTGSLEVLFIIAKSDFFIDDPVNQTRKLQAVEKAEKYLVIISEEDEHYSKLAFLENRINIDVYEKSISYQWFKKVIFHLFDLFERDKEMEEVMNELECTKLKLETDNGKIKILTNTISEPVIFVDNRLHVRSWSSEAESFFGYSKYEVVNESFLRWLISPKSHADIKNLFAQVENSGPGILKREQSFIFRNKLGVELPADVTISYLKEEEPRFNLVFVIHSKAKQLKLEKETIKARELREENKLIKELLHHVGHELRVPLNAVVGISKTLLGHSPENFTDRQREGLTLIQNSGENMLRLIKDLSGIAEIEAKSMQLNLEPFEFEKLLSQQKTQTLNFIGKKNIKFVLKRSSAIPPTIIGDATKINQILTNIIRNAVRYTHEGRITLSSHLIDNKLYFEISDTGVGIEKDKLVNLFDKYSRLKSSSKKTRGTGLGLHITKKLVELMNGEISAESNPGKGTTMRFYVSLPSEVKPLTLIESKPEIEKAGLRILNYSSDRKLILAIDNSLENTFMYAILSEQDKYSVMLCNNSKVALTTAREFAPDLLIIKLEMPGVHGASIIREIRKRNDRVPVIAFSEYEQSGLHLPENTILLNETINLESLHVVLQEKVKWYNREKLKGAVVVEDDRWLLESLPDIKGFKEIVNTEEELTRIKIGQRDIDYLFIEHVDKNSNGLGLFLNLLNENKTKNYKKIILHHEATPMKYLVDKVTSLNNVQLLTKRQILELNLSD